jgi:hypothetical protein
MRRKMMPEQINPSLSSEGLWKEPGSVHVKVPQSLAAMQPAGWVRLDLNISVEMMDALERLARESRVTVADVLARAVALYAFAHESHKQGRRVIVTSAETDPESEIEVTGF